MGKMLGIAKPVNLIKVIRESQNPLTQAKFVYHFTL